MIGWTLLMQDNLGNAKQVKNPEFIPRTGDRVLLGYTPAAIVNEIVVSYDEKMIIAVCA